MSQVLTNHKLPEDIVLQVTDMTRESIDKAIRQLTANGGGKPQQNTGYQFAARTGQELRGAAPTKTLVPAAQPIETGEPVVEAPTLAQIVVPKETKDGWAF